jgi:exodeoxyribonuclease VII large subunit
MSNLLDSLANRQVYSVSQLNNAARDLLENQFRQIWVEGEISNFSAPGSGHWYFSLKDDKAQIRCAMFRNRNRALKFRPKQGDHFIARGQISLYPARGDYQLIVENLSDAGAGAQQRAFEELKAKLDDKGWFNPEAKQHCPKHRSTLLL